METSNISANDDQKYDGKSESLDPDKKLFWKLYLGRKDAFVAMNNDVDEIVKQCLAAKRHLQAIEDSNRNLKQEERSLRSKYETLLEKNRKDTGIIIRLKDSESSLKKAVENKKTTNESLLEVQIKNKEKTLDRKLLQDDRDKLIFRSQAVTNVLRKKNLRHDHLYKLILDENKKYEENERQFIEETQQLKYILGKNDGILAKWLKDNAERDAAIRRLQDDMKEGLTIPQEDDEEAATEDESSEVDGSSEKTEIPQSTEDRSSKESSTSVTSKSKTRENVESGEQEHESREMVFEKEWLAKKILFEVAEKQKEHLINFYMILNKRMQDLHIEMVNVREWLIDKEAEKRDIWEKVAAMEKLVSEKRRQKPVPLRTSTDEIKIWIEVQRQTNDALRKIAYKCLSIKLEDSGMYSEFAKTIRNMYVNTLKEQLALGQENNKEDSTEKQDEEKA